MKHESTISAKSGKVSYKGFLGINRRLRADGGEFYDMENMSHKQYPCICSEKGYKKTDISGPDNTTIKKLKDKICMVISIASSEELALAKTWI